MGFVLELQAIHFEDRTADRRVSVTSASLCFSTLSFAMC